MEKIPMTAAGYATLESELKHCQQVERPRIIQQITDARTHGDLSENAEYTAARERQTPVGHVRAGLDVERTDAAVDDAGRARVAGRVGRRSAEDLLREADELMYTQKRSKRRGQVSVFP